MDETLRDKIIFDKCITGQQLTKKEVNYCKKQEKAYQNALKRINQSYEKNKGKHHKKKIKNESEFEVSKVGSDQYVCLAIALIILSMFVLWLLFFSSLTPYNLP